MGCTFAGSTLARTKMRCTQTKSKQRHNTRYAFSRNANFSLCRLSAPWRVPCQHAFAHVAWTRIKVDRLVTSNLPAANRSHCTMRTLSHGSQSEPFLNVQRRIPLVKAAAEACVTVEVLSMAWGHFRSLWSQEHRSRTTVHEPNVPRSRSVITGTV